jgi:hypothetical protein
MYHDSIQQQPNFDFDKKTKSLNADGQINVSGTLSDTDPRDLRGYDG